MKHSRKPTRKTLASRVERLEAEAPKTDTIYIELPRLCWREGTVLQAFAEYRKSCPKELRSRLQWSPICRWRGYREADRAKLSPEEVERREEGRRQWLMDVWRRSGLSEEQISFGRRESGMWPEAAREGVDDTNFSAIKPEEKER